VAHESRSHFGRALLAIIPQPAVTIAPATLRRPRTVRVPLLISLRVSGWGCFKRGQAGRRNRVQKAAAQPAVKSASLLQFLRGEIYGEGTRDAAAMSATCWNKSQAEACSSCFGGRTCELDLLDWVIWAGRWRSI
jgi:hypothetical protein